MSNAKNAPKTKHQTEIDLHALIVARKLQINEFRKEVEALAENLTTTLNRYGYAQPVEMNDILHGDYVVTKELDELIDRYAETGPKPFVTEYNNKLDPLTEAAGRRAALVDRLDRVRKARKAGKADPPGIIIPTDETALFNKTLAADAEFRDLDRAVRALYDNQHETRIIMGAQPIFRALIRAGVNTIKVPSKHADDPKAILKTAAKTLAKVRAKNAPPKGSAKTLIARIMLAYDHYRGTFELRSECKRNSMYWPRLDWETEQAKADIIALYKAITNTPKAEALFEDAFPIYAERVYRVVGGPNKDLIGTRAKKMKKGIEPPQP